jgi:hypothetical protein
MAKAQSLRKAWRKSFLAFCMLAIIGIFALCVQFYSALLSSGFAPFQHAAPSFPVSFHFFVVVHKTNKEVELDLVEPILLSLVHPSRNLRMEQVTIAFVTNTSQFSSPSSLWFRRNSLSARKALKKKGNATSYLYRIAKKTNVHAVEIVTDLAMQTWIETVWTGASYKTIKGSNETKKNATGLTVIFDVRNVHQIPQMVDGRIRSALLEQLEAARKRFVEPKDSAEASSCFFPIGITSRRLVESTVSLAVWLTGCHKVLGHADAAALGETFWLADLAVRQWQRLIALQGQRAAEGKPRISPPPIEWRLEPTALSTKWRRTNNFFHLAPLSESNTFAYPYGIPWLNHTTTSRDVASSLHWLQGQIIAASNGTVTHSIIDDFLTLALEAKWPSANPRHIAVLLVTVGQTPQEVFAMLKQSVRLQVAKVAVVYSCADDSVLIGLLRLFRLVSGRGTRIGISPAEFSVTIDEGDAVDVPETFEGPLVKSAVDACLAMIAKRPFSSALGEELCLVLKNGSAAADDALRSLVSFAIPVQHAVPFIFAASPTSSGLAIDDSYFVVMPWARSVTVDPLLERADLVLLDLALQLRTTLLGYLVFDTETQQPAHGALSFVSGSRGALSFEQRRMFLSKWRFDVLLSAGDPSSLVAEAAVKPPSPMAPHAAYLRCIVSTQSSKTCRYQCGGCDLRDREVTADLITISESNILPGAATLEDRLSTLASHMVTRLKLARLSPVVAGSSTSAGLPVVPLWGSLIVPKDVPHWIRLIQSNNETAVGRYVVVLNRADQRMHRFMTELRKRVTAEVKDDLALIYEFHPGNLGIANGWNRIGQLGFDGPRSVQWMIIMNNDINLAPGVLHNFTIASEQLKKLVAVHNLLGFASFAITELGWRHAGRFEPNLWPAYATDIEYLARIKSRGLLKVDFKSPRGSVSHVESVATRSDAVFRTWMDRLNLPDLLWKKWGLNRAAIGKKAATDDFPLLPFPFGLPFLPHNVTCVEPMHRQCIMTGSQPACSVNLTLLLQTCGVPLGLPQHRILRQQHSRSRISEVLPVDYVELVTEKIAPALQLGQEMKNRYADTVRDKETASEDSCFIPILVLAVFREVDALHDFLVKQPCAIGALVVRTVGPGGRARRVVTNIGIHLTHLYDPHLRATQRTSITKDRENFRSFTAGLLDFALLPRLAQLSVGAAFSDAVTRAEVFSNVIDPFSNLNVSEPAEISRHCLADKEEISLKSGGRNRNETNSRGVAWKRWALFVDVEQQLTDVAAFRKLALNMTARTANESGCRSHHVSIVTENFFAVTISALLKVPRFDELRGYTDVSLSFAKKLLNISRDRATVDDKFFPASTVSGYSVSRFEPFA